MSVRNKIVGATMIGLMSIGTVASATMSMETVKVEAASNAASKANSKLQQLYKSLHTNYLGIKNQGQWESYIKEIRSLVKKIPIGNGVESARILSMVDKAETLVNALAGINQVEKSLEINSLVIGNVKQWNDYLMTAKPLLSLIDKKEFGKEYSELANRMNKCGKIILGVQNKYSSQWDKVYTKMTKALETKNIQDAREAYEEAKKLEECEETDDLVYQCKQLLQELGDAKMSDDEAKVKEAFDALRRVRYDFNFEFDTTSSETLVKNIKVIVGEDIDVKVIKGYKSPVNQSTSYSVILSKGGVKSAPISMDL